jgi:hypothetical protein
MTEEEVRSAYPSLQREMATKDDESVRLILNEYLPFIGLKVTPALFGASYGPWLQAVVLFFTVKAERHLKAICVLCERGLGEDAQIIGRAIFEHRLHLAYITTPKRKAQREYRAKCFAYDGDRQRFTKAAEFRELRAQGKCVEWIDGLLVQEMEARKVRKPRGFKSLPSLKAMAEAVGGGLECDYHSLYWSLSKLAHPSGLGSASYVMAEPDGDVLHEAVALAFPVHLLLTVNALHVAGVNGLDAELEALGRRFLDIQRRPPEDT